MKNIEKRSRLYKNIEALREEMYRSSNSTVKNINNQETRKISRKLDKLIVEAMKDHLC
ncbi:MAG: aspartyl-phosphate phosphatase Spo0E family protein [Firmicutes bacterium]|nr:aspartyl-phosphate phosphatase Spo0E family protein [Bacillota bacterium]